MIKTTIVCDDCGEENDGNETQFCGYCNTRLYIEKAILLAEYLAKQEKMIEPTDQLTVQKDRLSFILYQVAHGFYDTENVNDNKCKKDMGKRLFDAIDNIIGRDSNNEYQELTGITKKVYDEVMKFECENPHLI